MAAAPTPALVMRTLLVAACLAAARAVIFQGGAFREEAMCQAPGHKRALGACRPPGGCLSGTKEVAGCGLPGAEYATLRCCAPDSPAAAADPQRGARSRQACQLYGKAKQSCDNFQPPAAGPEVRPGDFPYFAGLGYVKKTGGFSWMCGGGLISENFVLTGAVCAQGSPSIGGPTKVRLGDVSYTDAGAGPGSGVQELDVAEVIVHPEFNRTYNDIALLRLAGRAQFTRTVQPACLYTEERERLPVGKGVVAGIGATSITGDRGTLNKVDLPFVSKEKCDEDYKNQKGALSRGIESTMICAGEKGKDTCVGDSGAPLVVKEGMPTCAYQIVGLTSFGSRNCGVIPAVYTKVYSFLPWIEKIVWP